MESGIPFIALHFFSAINFHGFNCLKTQRVLRVRNQYIETIKRTIRGVIRKQSNSCTMWRTAHCVEFDVEKSVYSKSNQPKLNRIKSVLQSNGTHRVKQLKMRYKSQSHILRTYTPYFMCNFESSSRFKLEWCWNTASFCSKPQSIRFELIIKLSEWNREKKKTKEKLLHWWSCELWSRQRLRIQMQRPFICIINGVSEHLLIHITFIWIEITDNPMKRMRTDQECGVRKALVKGNFFWL